MPQANRENGKARARGHQITEDFMQVLGISVHDYEIRHIPCKTLLELHDEEAFKSATVALFNYIQNDLKSFKKSCDDINYFKFDKIIPSALDRYLKPIPPQ